MKPQPEYRIYNKKTGERAQLPNSYSFSLGSRDYGCTREALQDIDHAKRFLTADFMERYEKDVRSAEKTLQLAKEDLSKAMLLQAQIHVLFQDGLEIREATWTENPEKVVKDESLV